MLIYLNQNQTNQVYLTLREKSLLWIYSSITPYYLFTFKNQTTNQTLIFTAPNQASLSAQSSYDLFNITCTGSSYVNLSAGTISLNPGIFWEYKIYEQNQQFNFNVANTVSCVEVGKVFYSAATNSPDYISMTGNSSYITFNTTQ